MASVAYQPFPRRIAAAARERGPDLIDADDDFDRIIMEINYSFLLPTSYDRMANTIETTYTGVERRVAEWQQAGKLNEGYLPVFMNYGFYRQDYFGRLKPENAAFARQVAQEVDPHGFFWKRTGGFRPK